MSPLRPGKEASAAGAAAATGRSTDVHTRHLTLARRPAAGAMGQSSSKTVSTKLTRTNRQTLERTRRNPLVPDPLALPPQRSTPNPPPDHRRHQEPIPERTRSNRVLLATDIESCKASKPPS